MSKDCCSSECAASQERISPRYRRILQIALLANVSMFGIELVSGLRADSVSLLADAVDFAGDAANYGLSLVALAMTPMWRSRSALVKGISMGAYGMFVLAHAIWNIASGSNPEPLTMGIVGALALAVNVTVALMLYAYREGDANMRSVWLCSRNDAIANVAIILAAMMVSWLDAGWPDIVVAVAIACLALFSSQSVVAQARAELRSHAGSAS